MSPQNKRILTLLILVLPIFIAGILTRNLALDILPILAVAVFSFGVALRAKRNSKEDQA